jgi:hypothetical protein
MVNEAVLVTRIGHPINFLCGNNNAIEKGAVLKLVDPMTASGGTIVSNDLVAGICASEKISGNGSTSVSVYREGIFRMVVSGACLVGDAVGTTAGGLNQVTSFLTTVLSGARVLGIALESGATGESILVELKPTITGK